MTIDAFTGPSTGQVSWGNLAPNRVCFVLRFDEQNPSHVSNKAWKKLWNNELLSAWKWLSTPVTNYLEFYKKSLGTQPLTCWPEKRNDLTAPLLNGRRLSFMLFCPVRVSMQTDIITRIWATRTWFLTHLKSYPRLMTTSQGWVVRVRFWCINKNLLLTPWLALLYILTTIYTDRYRFFITSWHIKHHPCIVSLWTNTQKDQLQQPKRWFCCVMLRGRGLVVPQGLAKGKGEGTRHTP